MNLTPHLPAPRTLALFELLTLAGFGGVLTCGMLDITVGRHVCLAVMALGALAVVIAALMRLLQPGGALQAAGVIALLSGIGVSGAQVYFWSIRTEQAAIPLAGAGVLLLSLIGLVVSTVLLLSDQPDSYGDAVRR